jgi:hypothetical protein
VSRAVIVAWAGIEIGPFNATITMPLPIPTPIQTVTNHSLRAFSFDAI